MNLLFSMLLSVVFPFTTGKYYPSPGGDLRPQKLIEHYGYEHETHYITTEDFYILQFYRIPHGLNNISVKKRPPVLLMHGLGGTGADFVAAGRNYSLGYVLADEGYDVWIANARGTTYSRNHTCLDPDKNAEEFFNFSWHEIGYYDIPNAIDYILEKNGDDSLYYIGHSQGTTAFLVFASTRPEYSSKVKRASLMAPVAFFNHAFDFISKLARVDIVLNMFTWIMKNLFHEFLPNILYSVRKICQLPLVSKICIRIYTFTHPSGGLIDDEGFAPVLFANLPSSFASKQLIHYGQVINKGKFVRYDNDECYHLQNISIPMAFYYGDKDETTYAEDVKALIKTVDKKIIYDDFRLSDFGHADFLYNKRTIERLYNRMITAMKKKNVGI